MDTPSVPPAQIIAGTTVDFRRTYADFPANDGWALTFSLAGRSTATFTATADGADHVFALPAVETAALLPGVHRWYEQATKGAIVKPGESGTLLIEANPAAALGGELESKNERILALLETRLEGRITEDMDAYAVDGVQVSRIPFDQLRECIADYRALVAAERRGGINRPPLHYAFTRPGAF